MEPERRSHSPRHHRHHSRSPRRRWLPLKPIVHCQRSLYVLTTKIYVPLFKYTFTFNNHNYYVYTHISNNYYTLYKYTVLVLVEGVVVGAILLIETGAGHLDIAGQEEEGVVNCSLVQFPISSPLPLVVIPGLQSDMIDILADLLPLIRTGLSNPTSRSFIYFILYYHIRRRRSPYSPEDRRGRGRREEAESRRDRRDEDDHRSSRDKHREEKKSKKEKSSKKDKKSHKKEKRKATAEELEIQEANELRAKLGLKPLRVD